jgi:tRNA-Thr(GGU) m(6)t(6)A37 methyltransferase TsaA
MITTKYNGDTMKIIEFKSIGTIHTPFKDLEGMPIQPIGARGVKGQIELEKEYEGGLKDLDGFSHIILIYHLHLCNGHLLEVKPFLDTQKRGIFATRSPKRPNQIGISVVRLEKIEGSTLHIQDVDVVDGTPLLDIKPYIPHFDKHEDDNVSIGWFEDKHHEASDKRSDRRFIDD